jgi:hypothetical protein
MEPLLEGRRTRLLRGMARRTILGRYCGTSNQQLMNSTPIRLFHLKPKPLQFAVLTPLRNTAKDRRHVSGDGRVFDIPEVEVKHLLHLLYRDPAWD